MSEDLFRNASTPVPDEIWKGNQTPIQRQLAAVEFWDEMNGRKRASAKKKKMSDGERRVATGALVGAGVGALGNAAAHAAGVRAPIGMRVKGTLRSAATGAGVGAAYHLLKRRKESKEASFDGLKAFGQTLLLNPKSDDLERAFKHHEQKSGKSRDSMTQREIYNALLATGMGKRASAPLGPRIVEAIRNNPELAGAAMMGTMTGARALYDSGGVGPTGRSRGEADLLAAIAQRQQLQKDRGTSPGIRDRLLAKQLEIAEYDRKNRLVAALRDAAAGAGMGAVIGHGTKHLDKLGPLRAPYGV